MYEIELAIASSGFVPEYNSSKIHKNVFPLETLFSIWSNIFLQRLDSA